MTSLLLVDLRILFAGAAALVLPGYAWLAWFPHPGQSLLDRLAEAVGLSVALTGLAALGFFLLGVHLDGTGFAALLVGLLLAAAAGRVYRRRKAAFSLEGALGLLGLAALIAWRLYQARSLVLPAWVDSVHHTLIVRVMLETGGLPASLAPYIPVPFYYHYGFHAEAAVFTALAGLAPERGVLLLGQVLNAAVSLSIFRLGKALWGDARLAGAAALLSGFAFHMPAYYLSWGRYTLLAGLAVLPLAMAAAWEVARQGKLRKEPVARLAVLTGGLLVAHYLAAVLFALFLVVLGAGWLWKDLRRRQIDWQRWGSLLVGVGSGVLLALPWVLRVWRYSAGSFRVDAALEGGASAQEYARYLGYLAGPQRNLFLLLLGGLGLLWALRQAPGRALAFWGLVIALLSLPWGLRLGPFRPDHWEIVLFLPAALLAAGLLVSGAEAAGRRLGPAWGWGLGLVACLGLCLWGARETAAIVNPVTVLADQADVEALDWVGSNTPQQARLYINTAFWQGNAYRGVDGGWWALPLTGRQTLLPPAPYSWGDRAFTQQVTDWAERASRISGCGDDLRRLVQEAGITYLYLHAGRGSLQAPALAGCPGFVPVYTNPEVTIFSVALP